MQPAANKNETAFFPIMPLLYGVCQPCNEDEKWPAQTTGTRLHRHFVRCLRLFKTRLIRSSSDCCANHQTNLQNTSDFDNGIFNFRLCCHFCCQRSGWCRRCGCKYGSRRRGSGRIDCSKRDIHGGQGSDPGGLSRFAYPRNTGSPSNPVLPILPVLVPDLSTRDLAVIVTRKEVDDLDTARHLVTRDALP